MATSKTGGSRAYLRGRVGSDVYSIGKDAKGKKQQVVRSLAESVANPQSEAQMRGRMIMSTVMQAVAAMRPIIDHSFDNVPAGQPNISEFISRNYALIKSDVAAHASGSNVFGLNKYKEKGVKQGAYVISAGSAIALAGASVNGTNKTITIALGDDVTVGGLLSALGITTNDYFTACAIVSGGKFAYERFHVNPDLASDLTITSENIDTIFLVEGNVSVSVALSTSNIVITLGDFSANQAIIVSRKEGSGYVHSAATLAAPTNPEFNADAALPTYPVGQNRFLNGGGEESEVDPFEPEPFACTIASATADGSAWAKGDGFTKSGTGNVAVVVNLSGYESGHTIKLAESLSDQSNVFDVDAATKTISVARPDVMPTATATWTMKLYVDGELADTWGTITWQGE